MAQMTLIETITLVGLFAGPAFGAWLAGWLQDRSANRSRREEVFRTLMRTRRSLLSPDYVEALNVVEVDFYGNKQVIVHFKNLIQHYDSGFVHRHSEQPAIEDPPAVVLKKEEIFHQRIIKEREDLLTKLICAIGVTLGYKLEQLDVIKTAYSPQYFSRLEQEQEEVRRFVLDLGRSNRALPIAIFDNNSNQPKSE